MLKHFVIFICLLLLSSQSFGQVQKNKKQQSKSNRKSKETKKVQAPFQWVNEPTKRKLKSIPQIKHATFKSPSMNVDVGYCIYLPPQYESLKNKRFPAVYYLHGGRPGSELKSIRLVTYIDQQIKKEHVDPMIYVFVNGGPVSHYNMPDNPKAQGADVFIKELIPHIDKTYRTIAKRSGRAIEGFSQGGRGTTRLMFRYPELFCSAAPGGSGYATEKKISENGGAESKHLVFAKGDNTWDLAKQYAKKIESDPTTKLQIMVHVGDKGFNYQNNLEFMKYMSELGIEHQKIITPKVGHNAYEIYQKNGIEIMKFHASQFAK